MRKLLYIFIVIIAYIGICHIAENVLIITMLDLSNQNSFEQLVFYEFFTFSCVAAAIYLTLLSLNLGSLKELFDEDILFGCGGYIFCTTMLFTLLYIFFPSAIVVILYNLLNIGILTYWTIDILD